MMEFYDKYGKIKKISVKFEPVEKKEHKNNEVKKEPKPELKPEPKPEVKPIAEIFTEAKTEPAAGMAEEPAAPETEAEPVGEAEEYAAILSELLVPEKEPEPVVEVTTKHWTVPVPEIEEEPETNEEPEVAVEVSAEPELLPEVEVTSKHWTVPVPVVEPQLDKVKKEEDRMATNRFDKTPKKEINYCEDICTDEEQKKVCFYYRNKEYLTDDFMNKCDDARAYELNQKKEQEERAERERLLKELFGNQEE